ncbi:unnamed protein product [Parajaminaea phylloscopi]
MPTHFREVGLTVGLSLAAATLPAGLYESQVRRRIDEWTSARRQSRREVGARAPLELPTFSPPPVPEDTAGWSGMVPNLKGPLPECWGHRGASAAFPENTIASFDKAVRDGSEGIESDVHVTSDGVIVMFHDPSLERTTDGKGLIKDQPWKGVIEHVRTTQKPQQQLPTFRDICDLLMQPQNKHVKLNIDIKPENDPERLFSLMKDVVHSYPDFAQDLSPRLILGLWHPVFLSAALKHVPTLRRIHIGGSPWLARTYFWKHCDGFSMWFPSLVGADGQAFLEQARRDGKDVFVWTVNRKDEMIEATRWGVKAILTDKTSMLQQVRAKMTEDFPKYRRNEVGRFFRWTSWRYYTVPQWLIQGKWTDKLEKRAGVSFQEAWKTAEHLDDSQPWVSASNGVARAPSAGVTLDNTVPVLVQDEVGGESSAVSSPGFTAVNEKSPVPPLPQTEEIRVAPAIPVAA